MSDKVLSKSEKGDYQNKHVKGKFYGVEFKNRFVKRSADEIYIFVDKVTHVTPSQCLHAGFLYKNKMSNNDKTCKTGDEQEDEDFELEPDIKKELDHLNQCSAEINRLENEIDEARTKYRQTFHEASNKMSLVSQKRKKSIAKAREYYEMKGEEKIVQGESLKAARQYQSAIGVYRAAKETVALAEDRLVKGGEVQLSSAWQEMLNHATTRVMEAEQEKRRSEEQHMKMTKRCGQLEHRLHLLCRTRKRSITNARPYFELKQQLDLQLQQQKQNVTDLQSAIKQAKTKYASSLRKLEDISLAIHEARRNKLLLMYPRQPGVGAESDSLCSSLSELTLDSVGKEYSETDSVGKEYSETDSMDALDNDDETYDDIDLDDCKMDGNGIDENKGDQSNYNAQSDSYGLSNDLSACSESSKRENLDVNILQVADENSLQVPEENNLQVPDENSLQVPEENSLQVPDGVENKIPKVDDIDSDQDKTTKEQSN